MANERTILAASLLPGDHLVESTLGGAWDAEVVGVKPGPAFVEVVLAGRSQSITLCAFEICSVRRAVEAGTPAERAAWALDAELAEVAP